MSAIEEIPMADDKDVDLEAIGQVVRQRVDAIQPWFHSIDLGGGVITKGAASLSALKAMADIYFAAGIRGWSVLDVGAWDGFNSFEAEKRGASRVLAVDSYCWGGPGPGKREAFLTAHEVLASKVESQVLDIAQTTVENVGHFDVVLFNGIVYHILDPIHALLEMARIATKMLVVETYIDNLDNPRAVMNFFPYDNNPAGLPQNGWGPNSLLMHALLKHIGFATVLEFPTPAAEPHRSIFIALKPGHGWDAYVADNARAQTPRRGASPAATPPEAWPELMGWRDIARYARRRAGAYWTRS
jgi:tRNA (mo5U34)-methyltransferase